jgi:hypothetical protein
MTAMIYPADVQAEIERLHLRDEFAKAALSGIMASEDGIPVSADPLQYIGNIVRWSYHFADAMLAEREKKP